MLLIFNSVGVVEFKFSAILLGIYERWLKALWEIWCSSPTLTGLKIVMQDNKAKYVESTKQAVRLFFNLYYFFLLISFT